MKLISVLFVIGVLVGVFLVFKRNTIVSPQTTVILEQSPLLSPVPSVTPTPSPSPSPTPPPLPDPKIYGPCKAIPVVMYHHVQPQEQAIAKHQQSISVDSLIFAQQMSYLASKGYHTLTPDELLNGLTGSLPGRSILLTFDDGYADFYTYAYPELIKHNLRATMFLATGLVGNPDYLTWSEVGSMKGLVTFADHTWSHKSLGKASEETIKYEIGTAKDQLNEHDLGPVTAFAYPYGSENIKIDKILGDMGIKMAFTTVPGNYQCAKLPYGLRRIRIGNSSMASYGF